MPKCDAPTRIHPQFRGRGENPNMLYALDLVGGKEQSQFRYKVRKPQQIVSSIISHTTEYKALGKKEQNPKNQVPPKWSLPMHNYVKINTDGAYKESSRTGGWGFIMRNDQGFPVAAGCGHIQEAGSAMQAEAIAILRPLKSHPR
jgi:hypothetical protein